MICRTKRCRLCSRMLMRRETLPPFLTYSYTRFMQLSSHTICFFSVQGAKATPHKARLTAWRHICLHLFRHLARKFLAGRQPSGVIFIQSDEKSDCASAPPALCGVAFICLIEYERIPISGRFGVSRRLPLLLAASCFLLF